MVNKNETIIDNFKINYLSEELYREAIKNGNINPNELYMTPVTENTTNVEWDEILNKPTTFNPSSHMHYKSQISDFPSSMPASDVYSWAKASSKPSYNKSEIGLGNVDNTSDKDKSVKYATSAGSAQSVAWLNVSGKPSTFTPSSHSHSEYASSNHSHSGYASSSHSHSEYLNSSFSGYNSSDLTNPSYFAVWGNNQIRTLTTSNVCNVIGAAKSSHTHTGYASAYHSHSDYAQSVHNHVQLGYYEPSYQNDGDLWFKEV